jgi:thiol-disulfide isomerase/thioredoxin
MDGAPAASQATAAPAQSSAASQTPEAGSPAAGNQAPEPGSRAAQAPAGSAAAGPPPARRWIARLGGASRSGRIAWAAAAVVLAVIVAVSVAGGGTSRPSLPAAKNFALKELGHPGQVVSLAAFAGRPLIVNFFASWCPPCKRETPLLASFYKDANGGVVVIGVDANDEAGPAEQFLRKAGVTYPIGFDPLPASTTTSYGVYGLPQTFFLNSKHRIVKHVFGALTLNELHSGVTLMDRKDRG